MDDSNGISYGCTGNGCIVIDYGCIKLCIWMDSATLMKVMDAQVECGCNTVPVSWAMP